LKQLPHKTIISIIFIALAMINTGIAQVNYVDSLKQALSNTAEESSRAKILVQLAETFDSLDRVESIKYYSEALLLEKDKYSRAVINDKIGLGNWRLGYFQEAIGYFNKALVQFIELNDSTWLGKVNNNIAAINWVIGNRNEALKYFQSALKIRKAINDNEGVSKVLNNIGLIYQDWGIYEEALKFHNEALEIALNLGVPSAIGYSYSNIGKCYENKNEFETALKYHKLGYKYLSKENIKDRSNSFFLASIGDVYGKMGKLDSALYNFKESLFHAKLINNTYRIAIAKYNLGKIYLTINKIDSASIYINDSYELSLKNDYNSLNIDNQFALAEIEEKKGKATEALKHFKSATALKDSTFNKKEIKKFTDLQIKYNQEQESQENILLRKNNKIQELTIQRHKTSRSILIAFGIFILVVLAFISKSRSSLKKLSIKLEKSEEDLIEINANKDRFFTIVAHDLKSPFNGLLGITEVLDKHYDEFSSEKIKQMILLMKESSANIFALLEDLLQWAQIQTGRMKYKFENFDIFIKGEKVIELLNTRAKSKNILIENKIKEGTFVTADVHATETILRNLISNAIKFTEHGGLVKVEAENRVDQIAVSVSDNGVGMNDSVQKKLFKITEKVIGVGTDKEHGTGIGLIICKELIEKNYGRIWVESELGKGSKFIFTLPKKK